eukprot:CAMPEP_0170178256 /NCGR_PEP_ID=MMETSP0040_2-20121228/11767_1 /TAXON_ID=641309 /ORGANISM="Lotharella oceanica, Strain CCMP622" /LENGTH=307 /DNA_ID=CAMNT_0010421267 /DNA_START=17 /DNA_END=940 /DNA_ORIENTATION=-
MIQLLFLLSATARAENIVDIASTTPGLEILAQAVVAADLAEALSGDGPFTVFAPTNSSFEMLLDQLDVGLENVSLSTLTDILTYHVASGIYNSSDLVEMDMLPTLLGKNLTLSYDGVDPMIYDETDVPATVIMADVIADNGVIHLIDKVLLPFTEDDEDEAAEPTIFEIANSTAGFEILTQAVVLAGLEDVLDGEGNYTVFAPTNASFLAALDALDFDSLEDIPVDSLRSILLYHVVPEVLMTADLEDDQEWDTALEGQKITIDEDDGEDYLQVEDSTSEDATIIASDIKASNGVIQVIDKVLIPES